MDIFRLNLSRNLSYLRKRVNYPNNLSNYSFFESIFKIYVYTHVIHARVHMYLGSCVDV